MKKIILFPIWGLLLCFVGVSQAEEKAEPPPLDPNFMGSHSMVLVNGGYTLYASNMSTYKKPGNVQLVYKLKTPEQAVFYMVRDADLVTIKTKPFNLQRLMRGEEMKVKADVYMGHFDKGGVLTFKDMEFEFTEHLYSRELSKEALEASSNFHKYDTVRLAGKEKILIHQIQLPPSYDHLILFYQDVNCMTQFGASSSVPGQGEILGKLTTCGSMKPLYYSTDNFQ